MRSFNVREKSIIEKLLTIDRSINTSMYDFLNSFFFTEQLGKALIIQTQGQYAVFFLKTEVFELELQKKQEIEGFLELLSLISYLKYHGFISLFRGERLKTMYFLQDDFKNAQASSNTIILNSKGDYTSHPTTIHNKNNHIIYKGIILEGDTYEMIVSNTLGTLIVNESLSHLLKEEKLQKDIPVITTTAIQNNTDNNTKYKSNHIATLLNSFATIVLTIFLVILYTKIKHIHTGVENLSIKQDTVKKEIIHEISHQKKDSVIHIIPEKPHYHPNEKPDFYYGIDISIWNGNIAKDINAIDSLTFVICKATGTTWEGNYIDTDFNNNWKLIKDKKYIRGAYHFYCTSYNPLAQAEFFCKTVGKLDSTDMALIVDIEDQSLPPKTKVNVNQLQADLITFLNYVETQTKKTPIIYTSYYFAQYYLANKKFSRYPLWLAEYSKTKQPAIPSTWSHYKIWQKTDKYTIDSYVLDFDTYYGIKSNLYK